MSKDNGVKDILPAIVIKVMREGMRVDWQGFSNYTLVLLALSQAMEVVKKHAERNSITKVHTGGCI